MAVLMLNSDIPTKCHGCRFCNVALAYGYWCVAERKPFKDNKVKQDWCPLMTESEARLVLIRRAAKEIEEGEHGST